MEARELLDQCRQVIDENANVAVAHSGEKPWTSGARARFADDRIVFDLPESYPVRFLMKRPRVSFSAGPDESGREVHGNGIARLEPAGNGRRITCIPYRLAMFGTGAGQGAGAVIERRQNEWRLQASPGPVERKGRIGFWIRATRAITVPMSAFPILIGAVLAYLNAPVNWLFLILTLAGGIAAHMAANLLSDYFDFVKGVDTTNALSSHTGVLVDELADPDIILFAAMSCLLMTAFTGGALVVLAGWPVLLFGLAGVFGGYFYAGGRVSWKILRLGEVSTGFLLGPLMLLGSFYVQTGSIAVIPVLISLALGLLVASVSFGNNMRDALFDQEGGITTLPVSIGVRKSVLLLCFLLLLPYAFAASVIAFDFRLLPVLLVFFTLPWPISIIWKVARNSGNSMQDMSSQALRMILPLQAIKLHFRFCVLLFAGCVLAVMFPNLIVL